MSQVTHTEPLNGFINPANTGHPFDPIFLCRTQVDSILTQNVGTTPLTLDEIFILHQIPAGPPQFFFDNGSDTLIVGKVFKTGSSRAFFHVTYAPTIEGPVTDTIICEWDSAGIKKLFSSNILTGTGRLEHDTLAPSQSLYFGHAGNTLDIPIDLTRTLPADVGAMGMTFAVTYSRNEVQLMGHADNATLSDFIAPLITNDPFGNETTTFTLKSSIPITELSPILTLHLSVIAKNDTVIPLILSNAYFWGQNPQDTLCYVVTLIENAQLQLIGSNNSVSFSTDSLEVVSEGNKEIMIISNNVHSSTTSVQIFTLLGVEIASWEGMIAGNFRKTFSMPVSGVYFIKVKIEGKEYVFKRVL